MSGQAIVQVDAFTDRPFQGNPAAVLILAAERDASWMQQVARELNLAETAFLTRRSDGFALRWFTPSVEVALCGHATLAAAHVLWSDGELGPDETARFHTLSGLLTASRNQQWIWLDFPAKPVSPAGSVPGLAEALGVEPVRAGRNDLGYLIAELRSERGVHDLKPDIARIGALDATGVVVTAPSESERYDFVSRFFAPALGVPEDPVTGSAHCSLAPYWSERIGRSELCGYQASARGGTVRVRVAAGRVHLGGQAVTIWRGQLLTD